MTSKGARKKKYKIGVVGVGFVGGAVANYFKKKPFKLFVYDKFKKLGSIEDINQADIVFVCVPTPYLKTKGFDISAVEEAVSSLKDNKIIVIKSSILPGETQRLQKKYSQHSFVFNPEFLKEVTAYEDFINPDKQIIGTTKKSSAFGKIILDLLPKAPFSKVMDATEAEMVKYMANSFLALKVVFGNEFFEICEKMGVDYNQVREAVSKDPRIGESHFDVSHGGYKGYGGSCFPKDVNAIIQLAESKKAKASLLKSMREINRKLLSESGMSEDYFLSGKHKTSKTNGRKK